MPRARYDFLAFHEGVMLAVENRAAICALKSCQVLTIRNLKKAADRLHYPRSIGGEVLIAELMNQPAVGTQPFDLLLEDPITDQAAQGRASSIEVVIACCRRARDAVGGSQWIAPDDDELRLWEYSCEVPKPVVIIG